MRKNVKNVIIYSCIAVAAVAAFGIFICYIQRMKSNFQSQIDKQHAEFVKELREQSNNYSLMLKEQKEKYENILKERQKAEWHNFRRHKLNLASVTAKILEKNGWTFGKEYEFNKTYVDSNEMNHFDSMVFLYLVGVKEIDEFRELLVRYKIIKLLK